MDAVEFFKERKRMCQFYCGQKLGCGSCEANNKQGECLASPIKWGTTNLFIEAVEIVEKWSKNHPRKTRLQDFKEKYPLAKVKDENGKYNFCCADLGYCQCKYFGDGCDQCWNEPVE